MFASLTSGILACGSKAHSWMITPGAAAEASGKVSPAIGTGLPEVVQIAAGHYLSRSTNIFCRA